MTPKQIYSKTMPFVWAKLALALATAILSAIVFGVLMLIAWLFNSEGVGAIMLLIWLAATGFIRFAIMHYTGYLVKAGHVAVITETVTSGKLPANQVEYGKNLVKEKFGTSNVFFVLDKLVAGAVKQLQGSLERLGNTLDFIPGMNTITSIAKMFVGIALGYIDECCLGWVFYNKDKQGAFKSATDGVVIYAQNWKVLLKSAAKTTATVIALMAIIIVVSFLPLGILGRLLHISGFVMFIFAFIIAWAIKVAFIDSYMMIKMMVPYMEVAPSTTITFDLYDKLCKLSGKFRDLFKKAKEENPNMEATTAPAQTAAVNQDDSQAPATFCSACGAKNNAGAKFCAGCGKPLNG
ncbi:MAG: zinc ribbon domain-containing protein [Clostridiales bacterium]|jgi:hypothetical protein|nr:zinc ribbon domain-containing protein [Clostridiales bacterium]